MSFADLKKRHADYIVEHDGEAVGYRPHPALIFTGIQARVRRQPVSPDGEVLKNSIELFVSKTDVPSVSLKLDQVELTADKKSGEAAPLYAVEEILEGREPTAGHWVLRCTR